MGQLQTKNRDLFLSILKNMIEACGIKVSKKALLQLYEFILRVCPWFPEEGSLSLETWKKVGREVKEFYALHGPSQVPTQALSLWVQIRDLLVDATETELWGSQHKDEAQDDHTMNKDIEKTPLLAQASAPLLEESLSHSENELSDHEYTEMLDRLTFKNEEPSSPITNLFPVVTRPKPVLHKNLAHDGTLRGPLGGILGSAREASKTGDCSFAFVLAGPRALARADNKGPAWEAIPIKTLKELQSAVQTTGHSSSYTYQIIDMLSATWMTPYDWHNLAKAVLPSGMYVLFRIEYEDQVHAFLKEHEDMVRADKISFSMFMGTDKFTEVRRQAALPKDVLVEINRMAVAAWKNLPSSEHKPTNLTDIHQRQDEMYQDFVARLETALEKVLPPSGARDLLIKQLAWENANSLCRKLIRPIRKTGTLQDYIKICLGASPAVVQGIAYAAAMKGQPFAAFVQAMAHGRRNKQVTCFSCCQPGHTSKNCPNKTEVITNYKRANTAPSPCPRCKKGNHWAKECRSKWHKDGHKLTPTSNQSDDPKNFQRGKPSAP
ncbi:endogenous retrovirus group K member 5 Gag polyprotein-like isoform X1 [Talpa occidentalis]|uniref:endogenous retrovirus group K member 5 Gag polyprotein-like isoform X1 n=1 Tax=Talpa occidentalis TaxID=50954 RepID=UPI0023F8F7E8|nr:endogenous retrovirus group K member 5 Gag polyprotein-like isoform X1 [Talpa occidentalis]